MTGPRTLRERLVAPAMVLAGLLLVPWILYLSGELPRTTRARNWSLMWAGIDISEAVGLVITGILLWRRSQFRALPAAITCALLAADAWVDITTSAPGHARTMAVVMASVIEIPGAIALLVLALRAFPRVATPDRMPVPTSGPAPVSAPVPQFARESGVRI